MRNRPTRRRGTWRKPHSIPARGRPTSEAADRARAVLSQRLPTPQISIHLLLIPALDRSENEWSTDAFSAILLEEVLFNLTNALEPYSLGKDGGSSLSTYERVFTDATSPGRADGPQPAHPGRADTTDPDWTNQYCCLLAQSHKRECGEP